MKAYNIYYKNSKLNSKPLNTDNIKDILSKGFIIKKVDENKSEKINVSNLNIIKCTII